MIVKTFAAYCTRKGCQRPFALFTVDNPNPLRGCPYCGGQGVRYELVTAHGPSFPSTENEVTHPTMLPAAPKRKASVRRHASKLNPRRVA